MLPEEPSYHDSRAMPANGCPTQNELHQLAIGVAPDVLADHLANHVIVCQACRGLLLELERAAGGDLLETTLAGRCTSPSAEQSAAVQSILVAIQALDPQIPRSPASMPIGPSSRLAEYRLEFLIASGGMGQVWRARDERLDRFVAIKRLHQTSAKSLARFFREMQAVARLDHPNIVRAFHAGESDGMPYLVMELVDGANVSVVERACRPLAVADACELTRQMAVGAAYVHEQGGLIHRDIKPANAMLSMDGTVKLLDLGLAAFLDRNDESVDLTTAGNVLGTLDYMSPEQLADQDNVDQRTDIYSLGATLYRLLCGHAPYRNIGSLVERLQAMQNGDFTAVQQLRDDVPAELAAIARRALESDPAQRFARAAELATALEPFAKGADLATLSKLSRTKFAQADTATFVLPHLPTKHTSSRTEQGPQESSRHGARCVWILVALLLVCGAIITAFQLSQHAPNIAITLRRDEPATPNAALETTSTNSSDSTLQGSSRRSVTATSEPPPLEAWIADRKIITVAQDGSGDFTSINAAIRVLQPRQAVEILDRGPYTESLDIKRPPPDTGLISRCDTIIDGGPDSLSRINPQLTSLHRIHLTNGFRLHGLVFRSDDTRDTAIIDGLGVGGLVLENCLVKLNHPRDEVPGSDWFSVPLVRLFQQRHHSPESAPPPIVIRESAFAAPVEVFLCDDASDLLIVRNWFNRSIYGSLNFTSVPDHHGRHHTVIGSNLFDGTVSGTGISTAMDYSDREAQSLTIANNTFIAFGRAHLHSKLLEQADVIPDTALLRNHFHAPLGGIACTRTLGGVPYDSELATAAENTWRIADNSAHFRGTEPGVIQQPGGMTIWPTEMLSLDRANRNYLRFPADCPLRLDDENGSPRWIGALPPGPAPEEGDWFTHLLDRWNSIPQKQ